MGEKKLFSNKKIQTKKIQLCTAFGYNCLSIKSLLFWKEPFLTSSGARGAAGPVAGPDGAASEAGPLFWSRRCRGKRPAPRRSLLPLCPSPAPPGGFPSGPRSGHGAGELERPRGRRGGPDGECPVSTGECPVSTGEYRAAQAVRPRTRAGPARRQRAACRGVPGRPRGGQDCLRYRLVCFVLFLFLTRMRKNLPVFRREEASRSNISPEKLLSVAQESQATRATVETAPPGTWRGSRWPEGGGWPAGRPGCGGSADGRCPAGRGQPGRSAPQPPPAVGAGRGLSPGEAGTALRPRSFADRRRPQTGPS